MSLDQDVSYGVPCPGNNDILPIIKPCTGASTCISRATREFDVAADGGTRELSFTILNPANCTSGFEIIADMVNVGANVFFAANYTLPYWQKNFERVGQLRKAAYICCPFARALIPNFTTTGVVTFSLVNKRTDGAFSRVRIRTEGDGKLDIKDWFEVVPLSASCSYFNGSSTLIATCASNVSTTDGLKPADCPNCCPAVNLEPTNDAVMLYLLNKQAPVNSSGAFNSTIGFRDKPLTFTFFFTTTILAGGKLTYEMNKGLDVKDCLFSLDRLYNSIGEIIEQNLNISTKILALQCKQDNFAKVRKGFNDVVSELGDPTGKTFDEISSLSFLARAYPQSDDWQACEDLTLSLLTPTVFNETLNTKGCYADKFSVEWSNDPCCNPDLALYECCVIRNVSRLKQSYPVSEEALAASACAYKPCARDALQKYGDLQALRRDADTGCEAITKKVISSKNFTTNPVDACLALSIGYPCNLANGNSDCVANVDPSSRCQRDGLCSQPCQQDSDCVSGQCIAYSSYQSCKFYTQTDQVGINKATQCVVDNIDPYLKILLEEELVAYFNSSNSTFSDQLVSILLDFQCYSPYLDPAIGDGLNQTECEALQFCNVDGCAINSSLSCTEATCTRNNASYCADCRGVNGDECLSVSRIECQVYDPTYRNKENCLGLVDHVYRADTQSCLNADADNRNSCLLPCPSAFEYTQYLGFLACAPFCWAERKDLPGDTCPPSWAATNSTMGTINNTNPKCLLSGDLISSQDCVLQPNFYWFPGYFWVALYNSNDSCTGYCAGNSLAFTEADCLAQGTCSATCDNCTASQCNLLGVCEDAGGSCITRDPDSQQSCPSGYRWNPHGCANSSIDTFRVCNDTGGVWYPGAKDEATCLNTSICRSPDARSSIDILSPSIPQGYTLQDETQCDNCGGTLDSFYRFNPATYASNTWYTYHWLPRQVVAASWEKRFNKARFTDIYKAVQAKRFAPVQESELQCLFSQSSAILEEIACNCGERPAGSNCTAALLDTKTALVGVYQICEGIPANITIAQTYLLVDDSFRSPSSSSRCILLTGNVFPSEQFNSQTQVQLSSVSIKSSQSYVGDKRFFVNDAGIVVGQILTDGMSYSSNSGLFATGARACFVLPDINSPLGKLTKAVFVKTNNFDDFFKGSLSRLAVTSPVSIPSDRVLCLSVDGDDYTYFPVGLLEDWSSRRYINTWPAVDLFFIFLGAVVYTALLGASLNFLILHLKEGGEFLTLPKMALSFMTIFCVNRSLYFWMLPFGVLASNQALNTIFSELPILFFLSVYSFIVIRWAEIYHYAMESAEEGKLRWIVYAGNGFMYLFFIIVMILFFALYGKPQAVDINCSNLEQINEARKKITPAQVLGLIYKSFFVLVCLMMAGAFALYGAKISGRLKRGSSMSSDAQEKRFRKLLIASSVCTIALVLDAANLLLGSFDTALQRPAWSIMLILYIIEVAPSGLILTMFKRDSAFTAKVKAKISASSSTKLRSKSLRAGSSKLELGSNKTESRENDEKQISLKIKSDSKQTMSTDPSSDT